MNTREEIIEAVVTAYRAEVERGAHGSYVNVDDGNVVIVDTKEYEKIIRETLTVKLASLRPEERVRTCEDFGHLGIECCESCHVDYPHYELDLIDLESGGRAWICCAMDRALNPQRHQAFADSPESRETEKLLSEIFGADRPEKDRSLP